MTAEYDIGRARREASFFDSMATNGHEREDVRHGSYETITGAAIRCFSDALAESRLHLEVGAGTQPFSALLPVASQAVCVDVSFESLRLARRGWPRFQYVCCDATFLPFAKDVFDGVIGSAVLHHLDAVRCAPELLRVRKAGTVAAFSEPQAGNPVTRLYRRLHRTNYSPDERPLSERDLRAWNEGASVEARRLQLLGAVTSIAPVLRGSSLLVTSAAKVDAVIERWLPPLRPFYRYVILTLRKRHAG